MVLCYLQNRGRITNRILEKSRKMNEQAYFPNEDTPAFYALFLYIMDMTIFNQLGKEPVF